MNATLFRLLERLGSRQRLMGEVLLLPRTVARSTSREAIDCATAPVAGFQLRRT